MTKFGVILVALGLLYFYVFKDIFEKKNYGKSANKTRELVKVPVIEPDMKRLSSPRGTVGGKSEKEEDINSGIIHLWKVVSPNTGDFKLGMESDMLRKYINSESYWQLNMSDRWCGYHPFVLDIESLLRYTSKKGFRFSYFHTGLSSPLRHGHSFRFYPSRNIQ